jgi:preprotein translocase subunit SecE
MGTRTDDRRQPASPAARSRQLWHEVTGELRRVVWPTGRQTLNYTGFVVVAVVVVALITVLLDTLFNLAFSAVLR